MSEKKLQLLTNPQTGRKATQILHVSMQACPANRKSMAKLYRTQNKYFCLFLTKQILLLVTRRVTIF
jgi:hypothetical protein